MSRHIDEEKILIHILDKSWIIFLTNLESYFWQSWFVILKGVRYWVDQLAWFIIWVSQSWVGIQKVASDILDGVSLKSPQFSTASAWLGWT